MMKVKTKWMTAALVTALFLSGCSQNETTPDVQSFVDATEAPASSEVTDTAGSDLATLRDHRLSENPEPPLMTAEVNTDIRQVRNYPEQPPLIPHESEYYQIDKQHNQCLDCHSRVAIADSQAPMISITHYMDRDGQFLASLSPRRYFCNQCHISRHEVGELVENQFVDVDTVLNTQNGSNR